MSTSTECSLIALLHGPDRPGLVARTAGWIFERGGNILHADQHRDNEAGIFFQRIEWVPANGDIDGDARAFTEMGARDLGMQVEVARSDRRPRVAVFVSKIDHCFHDLMLRWRAGEFPCEIAFVLSNHPDMREASVRHYGVPFTRSRVDEGQKGGG
jgi:formyltetrahydrofolate deformylase